VPLMSQKNRRIDNGIQKSSRRLQGYTPRSSSFDQGRRI
jgi:hypothetical protein